MQAIIRVVQQASSRSEAVIKQLSAIGLCPCKNLMDGNSEFGGFHPKWMVYNETSY
jgi:hypothetical protein